MHLVAVLAALAVSSSSPSAAVLVPCVLDHPSGARLHARCGSVPVTVGTKAVDLGFAVIKATGAEASTTPLVMLAGGPGQSATRDFVALAAVIDRLRQDRDVVLVDVRGTGRSAPMSCVDNRSIADKMAGVGDEALLAACLAAQTLSLQHITTDDAVADLDVVRAALGAERWHVLGVSYGTRLAVAYDVAHHGHTASLVLDGVAPLDRPLGDDVAADMTASMEALGDGAVADFRALKASLAANPQALVVAHPTTFTPTPLVMTSAVVNGAVRMLLYADETRAVLPQLLRSGVQGDLRPLAAMAVMIFSQLGGAIHTPVNLAVLCAEDVPFLSTAPAPGDALFDDERTGLRDSCKGFTPAVRKPFRPGPSSTPTLLLSGERDPITPPHHARRAEALFPTNRHLVIKGHGHNVLPRGCVTGVVADTLAAVDLGKPLASVDADCIERLGAFPSFVDLMGPKP